MLLACGSLVLAALVCWLLWPQETDVTIGVEGQIRIGLEGGPYRAVPYTHGDALAVRVAGTHATAGGDDYDLRYMAYGPGEHDVSRYLVDEQGNHPAKLAELTVHVDALLADEESGELFESPTIPVDLQSNYRLAMTLAWSVWAILLVPLWLYGRKPRSRAVSEEPTPGLSERLRALLQTAEQHSLTPEQQADLEKLLLTFWADRLGISTERLVETLEQLRQDPAAGPQVAAVEQWLHQRDGCENGKVARQLLSELGWSENGSHGRTGQ